MSIAERVCPFCTGSAGGGPFCQSCGKNLTSEPELQTREDWDKASGAGFANVVGQIKKEHVSAGLAVISAAYGFGMALGVRQAALGGYARLFDPPHGPGPAVSVIVIAVLALFLLAIRFFWVPRSLYAYSVVTKQDKIKKRFRRLMVCHFPIVVIHAILFFVVCQVFADLAVEHDALTNPGHLANLESELVLVYGILLTLNGVWLIAMTDHRDPMPGYFWGINNVVFVALGIVVWFGLPQMIHISHATLTVVALALLIANGAVDLRFTAPYYLLFDSEVVRGRTMDALGEVVVHGVVG